jgi:hypothetical protein
LAQKVLDALLETAERVEEYGDYAVFARKVCCGVWSRECNLWVVLVDYVRIRIPICVTRDILLIGAIPGEVPLHLTVNRVETLTFSDDDDSR